MDDWTKGSPELVGYRCERGHRWYLPSPRCAACGGASVATVLDGAGTIFTRTTIHRRSSSGESAVGIALVDLDHGVRLMARCAPDVLIGSRVQVSIRPDGESGALLPMAEAAAA